MAEFAGHARPARMQRLLREAVWDEDRVRDDLREYVTEQLHHPDAVMIANQQREDMLNLVDYTRNWDRSWLKWSLALYYTMGHLTKFVRQGAVHIASMANGSVPNVAWKTPAGARP